MHAFACREDYLLSVLPKFQHFVLSTGPSLTVSSDLISLDVAGTFERATSHCMKRNDTPLACEEEAKRGRRSQEDLGMRVYLQQQGFRCWPTCSLFVTQCGDTNLHLSGVCVGENE